MGKPYQENSIDACLFYAFPWICSIASRERKGRQTCLFLGHGYAHSVPSRVLAVHRNFYLLHFSERAGNQLCRVISLYLNDGSFQLS